MTKGRDGLKFASTFKKEKSSLEIREFIAFFFSTVRSCVAAMIVYCVRNFTRGLRHLSTSESLSSGGIGSDARVMLAYWLT
ncbi:hypothetical protein E2C01_070055 [Portunus trituberculatus]|uniref:Uncharacterized protein n=1 Tax=Portunus trituberculatus TaxID=210409 RepID=A0A5B7HWA8_PORTR|nr:hypothetical protein [Portunus trituberculatus]